LVASPEGSIFGRVFLAADLARSGSLSSLRDRHVGGEGDVIVWYLTLAIVVALGAYTIVRLVRSWRAAR
jgi:hypothetical protein